MSKKQNQSPVWQLLSLVWRNTNHATGDSWERLNHSMHGALSLAINAGFPFLLDDFGRAMNDFRGGRWFHGEQSYAMAVHVGNLSACRAFEAWKKRKPFIADDVSSNDWRGNYTTRKRGRLAIGCTFPWQGCRVKVTSFSADESHLIACAYHDRKPDDYSNKVERRFPVTVAGIQAERALSCERERLRARLDKAWGTKLPGPIKRRLKGLGIATETHWSVAPIEMLRRLVKELEVEVTD